jgi:hypothetical protein
LLLELVPSGAIRLPQPVSLNSSQTRNGKEGGPDDRGRALIRTLQDRLLQGVGRVVPGWQDEHAKEHLVRYCARDRELYRAYVAEFPPHPAIISSLRRQAGDAKPLGGSFERDGLYCPHDGGLVGEDEQDAARNGWRCYINPSHCWVQS